MLVFDDIRNLWDIDLGSHPTAAARELLSPYVSSARGLQNFKALGIPPLTPYCNAGLQLINLDVWRNEGIAEKIIEHTRKYETVIRYWDQDGVNAVLAGRWMELDPVWNVEIEALMLTGWIPEDARRAKDIIDHTKILHFVVQKPWKKHCLHPRAALFLAYLEKTQWKDLALSLSRQ
jgi:lipopolysaccharide biosynthesis glycosyltransferase